MPYLHREGNILFVYLILYNTIDIDINIIKVRTCTPHRVQQKYHRQIDF